MCIKIGSFVSNDNPSYSWVVNTTNPLLESRSALGGYLNLDSDELVYIPPATHGVNIIAHSPGLEADDEILTKDHECGARDYTWDFICGKMGARYIRQSIPVPVRSEHEIVEQFWQGVPAKTWVISFGIYPKND